MSNLNREFLLPGEMSVTSNNMLLSTLLGSCVSICLFNQRNGWAGMNHFLLPFNKSQNFDTPGRYGESSIKKMIDRLFAIDKNPGNYTVSLYGGANVLSLPGGNQNIGANNVQLAKKMLANYGLKVSHSDVEGKRGFNITFNTENGKIEAVRMEESEEEKRLREERKKFGKKITNVLLVDDSKVVRSVVKKALQNCADINVIGEAVDPYEARSQILKLDPDVILLDIIMPKMNGLEFLSKLKAHLPKPVVILSTIAKNGTMTKSKALKLGATEVIDKDALKIYESMANATEILSQAIRMAPLRFKG